MPSKKQQIVVVNEYTMKKANGKGTRGSSLDAFVLDYMARATATDPVTPLAKTDDELTPEPHYARQRAVRDKLYDTRAQVEQLKKKLSTNDRLAGVAFGNAGDTGRRNIELNERQLSLSASAIRRAAKLMQDAFEHGKTVLKTVISFDPEYLVDVGVVLPDFHPTNRHVSPAGEVLGDIDEAHAAKYGYRIKLDHGRIVRDKNGHLIEDKHAKPLGLSHMARYKGDYKGNIDQMKLRRAIARGIERLSRSFDDLKYVAVIQTDTRHVHCHLAMVDMGEGTLGPDGRQKGKITPRQINAVRDGVDAQLRHEKGLKPLASQVRVERTYTRALIATYMRRALAEHSLPQALVAALPDNRRLWRAGSHDTRMRQANALMRQFVVDELARENMWPDITAALHEYAVGKVGDNNDAESIALRAQLVERGREQVIEDGMNAGYMVLKTLEREALSVAAPKVSELLLPDEETSVETANTANTADIARVREPQDMSTPQLSGLSVSSKFNRRMIMRPVVTAQATPLYTSALDFETLAARHATDPMFEFAYKLRSYSARLKYHSMERSGWLAEAHHYEDMLADPNIAPRIDPASVALHKFYCFEAQYQWMLADKYRALFNVPTNRFSDKYTQLMDSLEKQSYVLRRRRQMGMDMDIAGMRDIEAADRLGRARYGVSGGRLLASGLSDYYEDMLKMARADLVNEVGRINEVLADDGLKVIGDGYTTRFELVDALTYPFEQTKGLDMHHLGYDFNRDFDLDTSAASMFVSISRVRGSMLDSAKAYIVASGQGGKEDVLPLEDYSRMDQLSRSLADTMSKGMKPRFHHKDLTSGLSKDEKRRLVPDNVHTTSLDTDISTPLADTVSQVSNGFLNALRREGGLDLDVESMSDEDDISDISLGPDGYMNRLRLPSLEDLTGQLDEFGADFDRSFDADMYEDRFME